MTVEAADSYPYASVQSSADYASAQSARQTRPVDENRSLQGAEASPEIRSRQQERTVKLYFFDENLGQNVNLLV